MRLHILKTNIESVSELNQLNTSAPILKWTVDLEDVDRVLRIESQDSIETDQVIQIIQELGIECEDLPE